MVTMKKSISLVLLCGLSVGFLNAGVKPISQARIEATVVELDANDNARLQWRLLLASLTLGTTGFYAYRWLNQKAEKATKDEKIEDLDKRTTALEDAAKRHKIQLKQIDKKKKKESKSPWYEQFASSAWNQIKATPGKIKNAVTDLPNTIANGLPWAVSLLAMNNLMPIGNRFLRFLVPTAGRATDYLFQSHTISWFIENKINLQATIEGLMRWIEEDKDQVTNLDLFKGELEDKTNTLLRDVEGILGYMKYVTNQLQPQDDFAVKKSESTQKRLREQVQVLSSVVNKFLTEQGEAASTMAKLPVLHLVLRNSMLKIIGTLKDFEPVHEFVGYQDTTPTRKFTALHEIITKGAYRAVQEEELRAMIADLMGQMQLEALNSLNLDPTGLLQKVVSNA